MALVKPFNGSVYPEDIVLFLLLTLILTFVLFYTSDDFVILF